MFLVENVTWPEYDSVIYDYYFSKHYKTGPAELLFGGKSTGVKGLNIIFDSGSSYTYFNSVAYTASINLV